MSMRDMKLSLLARAAIIGLMCFPAFAAERMAIAPEDRPQTWFHLIGGNVSKEGLTADLEAFSGAGIGGIQLFHGQMGSAYPWPRTPSAARR